MRRSKPLSGGIVTIYRAQVRVAQASSLPGRTSALAILPKQTAKLEARATLPRRRGCGESCRRCRRWAGRARSGALFVRGNFNAVKSGLLTTKVPSRPSTLANHIAVVRPIADRQFVQRLVVGRGGESQDDLGLSKPCAGSGRANPAHGAQRGQGVEERLQVGGVDRALAFDPFPILRTAADERLFVIDDAGQAMNPLGSNLKIASSCHCDGSTQICPSSSRLTATMNGSSPTRA